MGGSALKRVTQGAPAGILPLPAFEAGKAVKGCIDGLHGQDPGSQLFRRVYKIPVAAGLVQTLTILSR